MNYTSEAPLTASRLEEILNRPGTYQFRTLSEHEFVRSRAAAISRSLDLGVRIRVRKIRTPQTIKPVMQIVVEETKE